MQTSRLALPVLLLALLAAPLRGQATSGSGEDALTLTRGQFRIRAIAEISAWSSRYGEGSPGRSKGAKEPLGLDFTTDSLGPSVLETLLPVQNSIRSLAGLPNFGASLGALSVGQRNVVSSTPVMLEYGVTSRLTVGVLVPFVTSLAEVDLRVNPTGREPTVGLNPARLRATASTTNLAVVSAFDAATNTLNARITTCAANPALALCTGFNATAAASLTSRAAATMTQLSALYGGRTSRGAPFVPVAGSAAQAAIETRLAALRTDFAAFGNVIAALSPIAAAPMTVGDLSTLLTDSLFGVNSKPIAGSITRGVGDIEVSAKFLLLDPFHGDIAAQRNSTGFQWRQSVGAIYRMGTGTLDLTTDFNDVGTGDHQRDIGFRSWTDLLWGNQFWMSIAAKYDRQLPDALTRRITDGPARPIAASYREQSVSRDLGDIMELSITPRWSLNEWVGIAGQYTVRTKGADSYSGTFTTTDLNGAPITLDASVLNQETQWREQRLGFGLSYSTLAAYDRGGSRLPYEITWMRTISASGTGGNLPVAATDLLQFRWYGRLFGRR
jgi:hypothetical protein